MFNLFGRSKTLLIQDIKRYLGKPPSDHCLSVINDDLDVFPLSMMKNDDDLDFFSVINDDFDLGEKQPNVYSLSTVINDDDDDLGEKQPNVYSLSTCVV